MAGEFTGGFQAGVAAGLAVQDRIDETRRLMQEREDTRSAKQALGALRKQEAEFDKVIGAAQKEVSNLQMKYSADEMVTEKELKTAMLGLTQAISAKGVGMQDQLMGVMAAAPNNAVLMNAITPLVQKNMQLMGALSGQLSQFHEREAERTDAGQKQGFQEGMQDDAQAAAADRQETGIDAAEGAQRRGFAHDEKMFGLKEGAMVRKEDRDDARKQKDPGFQLEVLTNAMQFVDSAEARGVSDEVVDEALTEMNLPFRASDIRDKFGQFETDTAAEMKETEGRIKREIKRAEEGSGNPERLKRLREQLAQLERQDDIIYDRKVHRQQFEEDSNLAEVWGRDARDWMFNAGENVAGAFASPYYAIKGATSADAPPRKPTPEKQARKEARDIGF